MTTPRKLRPCPCGQPAVWQRTPPDPEETDANVCLLTDADFIDDYCDPCFARLRAETSMPPTELARWRRLPS